MEGLTHDFRAAAQGFCKLAPREQERLVQMLAYVRKDDDTIPDTWPGGMVDDHDLMRVTCREFGEALNKFKGWRLAHQVPALWPGATTTAAVCRLEVGSGSQVGDKRLHGMALSKGVGLNHHQFW